jgi:hypothetical protein
MNGWERTSIIGIFVLFSLFSTSYAQEYDDVLDGFVDQASKAIESIIGSIEVSGDNPIDTNQEEVDNLSHSASEWFKSLFDFGKKTHAVTEDTLSVVAPSWIAPVIILIISGGIVLLVMYKSMRRVGLHLILGIAILAGVIVFLMLLDILS